MHTNWLIDKYTLSNYYITPKYTYLVGDLSGLVDVVLRLSPNLDLPRVMVKLSPSSSNKGLSASVITSWAIRLKASCIADISWDSPVY